MTKDLIVLETPTIPEKWSYQESVGKVKQLVTTMETAKGLKKMLEDRGYKIDSQAALQSYGDELEVE